MNLYLEGPGRERPFFFATEVKPQGLEMLNNSPGSSKACAAPCALSPSLSRESWFQQAVGFKTSTAGGGCQLAAKGSCCCLRKQRDGDLHPIFLLSILLQLVSIATGDLPFPVALPAPDSHSQHHPPEVVGPKQQQPHILGVCVGAKGFACCLAEALKRACMLWFGAHMPLPAATLVRKYMYNPSPAGF